MSRLKAQVSIEFLAGFIVYLVFISVLLTALFNYSNSVKEHADYFEKLKEAETLARLYDAHECSYGHITTKIENKEFEFFENLIIDEKSNVAIETLYSGGSIEAEPV